MSDALASNVDPFPPLRSAISDAVDINLSYVAGDVVNYLFSHPLLALS